MNLRELVRDTVIHADDLTLDGLAEDVLAHIDPADYEEALRVALRVLVREVMVTQRGAASRDSAPGHGAADAQCPGAGGGSASWKVTAWQSPEFHARLDEVYSTPTGYKRLRDMLPSDMHYQAELLRGQAAAMVAKAEWFDNLARAVLERGHTTLGDLIKATR